MHNPFRKLPELESDIRDAIRLHAPTAFERGAQSQGDAAAKVGVTLAQLLGHLLGAGVRPNYEGAEAFSKALSSCIALVVDTAGFQAKIGAMVRTVEPEDDGEAPFIAEQITLYPCPSDGERLHLFLLDGEGAAGAFMCLNHVTIESMHSDLGRFLAGEKPPEPIDARKMH